jgi:hypothetical protein
VGKEQPHGGYCFLSNPLCRETTLLVAKDLLFANLSLCVPLQLLVDLS